MTNTVNKVLAVVVSVASVAFLTLVLAYVSGGVNWQSEARASDLNEYYFTLSEGENPQWTVKGVGDKVVATVDGNKLPEAILKARKDLETRKKAELAKFTQQIPAVEARLSEVQQLQAADEQAMAAKEQKLRGYLAKLNKAILGLSDQLAKRVLDTTAARTQAANRRKDVYRLTNELEVLRTDRARLVELRRELTDELLRLQISNQSLKQRVEQSLTSN